MKNILRLLFLTILINVSESYVQAQDINCISCLPQCLCNQEIGNKFNSTQKLIINNNWNDFEGADLEKDLPSKISSNIISLRFDGLGCIYPSTITDTLVKDRFLKDREDYRALISRSFYSLLRSDGNALDKTLPNLKPLLAKLSTIAASNFKRDEDVIKNFFLFRETWNNFFLQEFINFTHKRIAENNLDKMFVFIPGYNVPYSLAHLQGNRVFEDIDQIIPKGVKKDRIQFVRIFWPSNNQKYHDFDNGQCNMDNQKNLRNGILNDYVTNRAYLTSLSLRKFISELDSTVQINVISHSFGAVISTGIVLNPIEKISFRDRKSTFNQLILKEFDATLPKHKISLFLNAPAIPGSNTFIPLDKVNNANHHFFIGFNPQDEMLSKKMVPIVKWFTSAKKRNATTLGSDWKGEIYRVKKIVQTKGLDDNFTYCPSLHKNHDYFCYRQQERFKSHFSNYIRHCFHL